MESLRLHLDEGQFDIFLDIDFRRFALIHDVVRLLGAFSTDAANLALDFSHEFSLTLLQHLLEVVVSRGLRGRDRFCAL